MGLHLHQDQRHVMRQRKTYDSAEEYHLRTVIEQEKITRNAE